MGMGCGTLNAEYALPHDIAVSGAVGFVTANDTYDDYTTWNLGAAWKPVEAVTVDARYHSGPQTSRFVLSVSFESSARTLGFIH